MTELFINTHYGLGDLIICNGLVRYFAERYDRVYVPCHVHNLSTVEFMFSDDKRISVVPIPPLASVTWYLKHYSQVLHLGFHGKDFDRKHFDRSFYEQAGVPFELRWEGFKFPKKEESLPLGSPLHAFIHEDRSRGYNIDPQKVGTLLMPYRPHGAENIFDYLPWIISATEVHCIQSCFLHLIDSLPETGQKLNYHSYSRVGDEPALKRNWTILK